MTRELLIWADAFCFAMTFWSLLGVLCLIADKIGPLTLKQSSFAAFWFFVAVGLVQQ